MFCLTVYLFLLLTDSILCESPRNFFDQDVTKRPYHPHMLKDVTKSVARNKIHTSGATKRVPLLFTDDSKKVRNKRGIVLIDEDFDKLPYVGIRQGWSGGITEPEEEEFVNETKKELFTEEGSGSSILQEQSSVKFDNTTPAELHMTKEKEKPTPSVDNTVEGSGDDIITPIPPTEEKDLEVSDDFVLLSCLNFTCDAKDLIIQPGFTDGVPEDTSLIISCSVTNRTSGDLLRWYRNNDSDSSLLEASATKNQLQIAIPKAKAQDSGTYLCVRLSEHSCCHQRLDVKVYKKPNYKYHLLIVGLVALVSLFTCLLLGIHRRYKIKQYKKEIKTQIPLNEFLL